MKTKRILTAVLSLALVLVMFAGCGGSASSGGAAQTTAKSEAKTETKSEAKTEAKPADDGQVYELSFTIHDPAESKKTAYYQELAAKTLEATNGKLNITVYPAGSLVASTDVAEAVLNDVADIGWMCVPFFPGQFPLTEVASLPMLAKSSKQATTVLNKLYEESEALRAETSMYKVFQIFTTPPLFICGNDEIRTPADLKGKTMRAPSGVSTEMMTAWGASPVAMGPGDIYQSIQKGVIDGAVFEWAGIGPFKLTEVMNYYYELQITPNCYYVIMNLDEWNKLPEEYQKVMDEIWGGLEASLGCSAAFQSEYDQYREEALANSNLKVVVPTEEERAQWKVAADEYAAKWVDAHQADGFDAQAYYDLAVKLFEETPAE